MDSTDQSHNGTVSL